MTKRGPGGRGAGKHRRGACTSCQRTMVLVGRGRCATCYRAEKPRDQTKEAEQARLRSRAMRGFRRLMSPESYKRQPGYIGGVPADGTFETAWVRARARAGWPKEPPSNLEKP